MRTQLFLALALFYMTAASTQAAGGKTALTLYVSLKGNDHWSGRLPVPNKAATDGPLGTVAGARDRIRSLRQQGVVLGKAVTVLVRGGTYFLTSPLIFAPEDSGTAEAPVTYAAYPGEKPTLSGGRRLTGWSAGPNGLWTTPVPDVKAGGWYFHQLFVNGVRRPRPVLPQGGGYLTIADAAPSTQPARGPDGFYYAPGDFHPSWRAPGDIEVHVFHIWTTSRLRIASLDDAARLVRFTGPTWSTDPSAGMPKGGRYRVENVFEALPNEPGAWYLDRQAGLVYYHPLPGENRKTFAPIVSEQIQLVVFAGDVAKKQWVSHLILRGLTFADADWELPPQGHVCSQAEVSLRPVVLAFGLRNSRLENCEFTRIAANAVQLAVGCADNALVGCRVHDIGGDGIRLGDDVIYADEDSLPQRNLVENCRIYDVGQISPGAVGLWIGQSPGNKILHNDIHDMDYTAISLGWTWGYGPAKAQNNEIAYNRIYNIGRGVLSDMGGIYMLGNVQGSVLSHNLIHDVRSFSYGGWGIYTDEGTTGVRVEDNIVYGCKSAGFHQHYGKDNLIDNNIFAMNTEAQLARTSAEDHLSFTFTHNIVDWTQGDLLWGNWTGGQIAMDDNLYWNADKPIRFGAMDLSGWQKMGHGAHSVVADPQFVSAAAHDFRLRPGSPALAMGFHSIDLAGVGAGP